jgi:hypothetical protein
MKEKQDIEQRLKNLKQNYHPEAPDGYFEQLEKEILEKTIFYKPVIRVMPLWKKITAMAAALAVLLLGYTFLIREESDRKEDVEVALHYLMHHTDELDRESILKLVSNLKEEDLSTDDLFFTDDLDEEALIKLLDI